MTYRASAIARRTLTRVAIFGLLVTSTLTMAQQAQVGVTAAIHNYVQLGRGKAAPRTAVVRERVILNDEVRTGRASQLQILLQDRTTFTVGADARITIDRFVYDPNRSTRIVSAKVAQGAFRFMSGRTLGKASGPATVRTPVGTLGIRGTIVEGVVGGDAVRIALAEPAVGNVSADLQTATLVLLRGPGPRVQGDAKPGAIDVTAGKQTFIIDRPNWAIFLPGPGMPAIGPFEMSSDGLRSFQGLLRTVPLAAGATAKPGEASWPGPAPAGVADPWGEEDSSSQAARSEDGRKRWTNVAQPLAAIVAAILAVLVASGGDEDVPVSP